MHLFHKWTKWEEYDESVFVIPGILFPKEHRSKTYREIQKWQKRQCVVCGKTQRIKV